MAKNKQRNELSIFEDFRLKPAKDIFWSSEDPPEAKPGEGDLKKIDYIYYYFNEKFKKNTYWIITKSGRISQVNEYGEPVYPDDVTIYLPPEPINETVDLSKKNKLEPHF